MLRNRGKKQTLCRRFFCLEPWAWESEKFTVKTQNCDFHPASDFSHPKPTCKKASEICDSWANSSNDELVYLRFSGVARCVLKIFFKRFIVCLIFQWIFKKVQFDGLWMFTLNCSRRKSYLSPGIETQDSWSWYWVGNWNFQYLQRLCKHNWCRGDLYMLFCSSCSIHRFLIYFHWSISETSEVIMRILIPVHLQKDSRRL